MADPEVARWAEERANEYLLRDNTGVCRGRAGAAGDVCEDDIARAYVDDLGAVVDLPTIRAAAPTVVVGSRRGAGCWERLARVHGLRVEFADGAAGPAGPGRLLLAADADAGGVRVGPAGGEFLAPDGFLAAAARYLLGRRPGWPARAGVGMSLVGSQVIHRVAAAAGRPACQYPPGFRWFADGLFDGTLGFAGEGTRASFLRFDGTPWATDGDGLALALLAAEMTARTGKDVGELGREVAAAVGPADRTRIDLPASPEVRAWLRGPPPEAVGPATRAGEPVTAVLTRAQGNGVPAGGVKVVAPGGWFAALASEADDACTVYAESFRGPDHLGRIVEDARRVVTPPRDHGTGGGR